MEDILSQLIHFCVLFAINGGVLYVAMQITGVSAYLMPFLILNAAITLPSLFLSPLAAIAVATVLFWILVFKCTDVDSVASVMLLLVVANLSGALVTSYLASRGMQLQQLAVSEEETDAEEERAGDAPHHNLDLSGLRVVVTREGGSDIVRLVGHATNEGDSPLRNVLVSFEYKTLNSEGFGTHMLGTFAPGQQRAIDDRLDAMQMHTVHQGSDIYRIEIEHFDS